MALDSGGVGEREVEEFVLEHGIRDAVPMAVPPPAGLIDEFLN